jgi:hypothetical protein
VGRPVPAVVLVVKDLVVVGVECYGFPCRLGHVVVKRTDRLEAVVNDEQEARLVARSLRCPWVPSGSIGIVPVLTGSLEQLIVKIGSGLIQEGKSSDDLVVRWVAVFPCNPFDNVLGAYEIVIVGSPARQSGTGS